MARTLTEAQIHTLTLGETMKELSLDPDPVVRLLVEHIYHLMQAEQDRMTKVAEDMCNAIS